MKAIDLDMCSLPELLGISGILIISAVAGVVGVWRGSRTLWRIHRLSEVREYIMPVAQFLFGGIILTGAGVYLVRILIWMAGEHQCG